jgi:amidase
MARSARDLLLALEVLGGADADGAKAWRWRLPPPRHRRLQDFRVGCVIDDPVAPIASDIRERYEDMLSALIDAGVKPERGWPAGVDLQAAARTYGYLLMSFVTADLTEKDNAGPADVGEKAGVQASGHARWLRETLRRLAFRAIWATYFENHDVFLLPASFTAAFPHDHSEPIAKRTIDTPAGKRPYIQDVPYWISTASLAGLPATVAPLEPTAGGLPVGIQIVAPMWEDATSIEFAALMSEVIGGFKAPAAFAD